MFLPFSFVPFFKSGTFFVVNFFGFSMGGLKLYFFFAINVEGFFASSASAWTSSASSVMLLKSTAILIWSVWSYIMCDPTLCPHPELLHSFSSNIFSSVCWLIIVAMSFLQACTNLNVGVCQPALPCSDKLTPGNAAP